MYRHGSLVTRLLSLAVFMHEATTCTYMNDTYTYTPWKHNDSPEEKIERQCYVNSHMKV